jgi:hypothetical protein
MIIRLFIVYFFILYKPISLLYKLSGIMMTGLILAGYGICIANIIYTSKSVCKTTTLGKLSLANSIIFLIVASIMLVFTHTIIWIPICKNLCSRNKQAQQVIPKDESVQEKQKLVDTTSSNIPAQAFPSAPPQNKPAPTAPKAEAPAKVVDNDGIE